ncbi:MAG TPA: hypothetical protein VM345_14545 [Acidimicrobiales bacterium]|jgi:hypothetical protein|nr:hypothetical protein [Acidimicrobiales bacterium]
MAHPIERLRWVARADGAGASVLARDTAAALASVGDDLPALVTGCRRIIERHPAFGPLWWVAARMLAAENPAQEAWVAAAELETDDTASILAAHLPDEATAVVLGWPEIGATALRKRGDVEVFVVDSNNEGPMLVRRLESAGVDAYDVHESGLGTAIREASMVILEAEAVGPDGFVATKGSLAAAATARQLEREVWVVAGVGRVLPGRLWEALVERMERDADPWDVDQEIVPLDWATTVVGPTGPLAPGDAAKRADCAIAPELLRWEK